MCSLSRSPVVPPSLSARKCGTAWSASRCLTWSSSCCLPTLVLQLPPCCKSSLPGCPSLPLLQVWMSVSSLAPWLSAFHTVRFPVSYGYLFLNLLLSFWLCEGHSVSTYASVVARNSINQILNVGDPCYLFLRLASCSSRISGGNA